MYVGTNPSGQGIGFAVARRNERLRLVFVRTGLKKKIGDANLFPRLRLLLLLSRYGFAAGCEAGLCPAVSLIHFDLGYAPGSGSAHKHRAKPEPGA